MKDKSLIAFLLTSCVVTLIFAMVLSTAAIRAASAMAAITVYVFITHVVANKCTKLSERALGVISSLICATAPFLIILLAG